MEDRRRGCDGAGLGVARECGRTAVCDGVELLERRRVSDPVLYDLAGVLHGPGRLEHNGAACAGGCDGGSCGCDVECTDVDAAVETGRGAGGACELAEC